MRRNARRLLHARGRTLGVHLRPRARASVHAGRLDSEEWNLSRISHGPAPDGRRIRHHYTRPRFSLPHTLTLDFSRGPSSLEGPLDARGAHGTPAQAVTARRAAD